MTAPRKGVAAPAHTPTPWRVNIRKDGQPGSNVVAKSKDADTVVLVAQCPRLRPTDSTRADAERIVACVNERDEMIATLREAADYLHCIPESAAGGDDEAVRLARLLSAVLAKAAA